MTRKYIVSKAGLWGSIPYISLADMTEEDLAILSAPLQPERLIYRPFLCSSLPLSLLLIAFE